MRRRPQEVDGGTAGGLEALVLGGQSFLLMIVDLPRDAHMHGVPTTRLHGFWFGGFSQLLGCKARILVGRGKGRSSGRQAWVQSKPRRVRGQCEAVPIERGVYPAQLGNVFEKVVGCVDRRRGRHEGGVLMYVRVLMLVMMHLRTQRVGGRGLGRLRGTMMVGRGRPGGRRGGGEEARVQFPPQ